MGIFMLSGLLAVVPLLGVLTTVTAARERLPAPISTELHTFIPPKIIINWQPVSSDLEPVLGYKVRLWAAKGIQTFSEKIVNGTSELVEELKMPKLIDFTTRDGKLYEYLLTGANHTQIVIHDIKVATPYLYQVLAFGARGDGETTATFGFELNSPDDK